MTAADPRRAAAVYVISRAFTMVRPRSWSFSFIRLLYCAALAAGLCPIAGVVPPVRGEEPSPDSEATAVHPSSTLPGIVQPAQHVTLSAPFNGTIIRIAVCEGDPVRKGQVVAVMDDEVAKAAVAVAERAAGRTARIRRARSELQFAQRYLARLTETKDIASAHALDQARAAVDAAQSELDLALEQQREAQATLKLEQARLAAHTIRAPFDGQVIRVDAVEGETLSQAEPLLTIVNLDRLEADLHLPVSWFGELRVGMPCLLDSEQPVGHPIEARITVIEPRINAATRTFRCVVEIDNAGHLLPAGFAVRLRVAPFHPDRAATRQTHSVSTPNNQDTPIPQDAHFSQP